MTRKPKLPNPPPPSEISEETLILDPNSSTQTQQMTHPPGSLEETLILSPGAGDITASGLDPRPTPEASSPAEGVEAPVAADELLEMPPVPNPEFGSDPGGNEGLVAPSYGLWAGLAAGLLILVGAFWFLDWEKPAPVSVSTEAEGQESLPTPVPAAYQETLRQAQGGDVAAMRTLGAVYAYGLGVPPHRQEGLRWYRKAADAGSAIASEEAKALEGASKR